MGKEFGVESRFDPSFHNKKFELLKLSMDRKAW